MKEFVDKLRRKREERGLTLKEVSEKTNVRKKYLKAIEAGEFEEVDGEVFLKGFIKVYANFLGLNVGEILAEYEQYKQSLQVDSDETKEKSLYEKMGKYVSGSQNNGLSKKIIIIIIIIFVLLSAYLYNNFFVNDNTDSDENGVVEETEVEADEIDETDNLIEENDGLIEDDEEDEEEEEDDEEDEEEEDVNENDTEELEDEIEEDSETEELEEESELEELESEIEADETEEIIVAEENLIDDKIEIEIVTLEETWYSVTTEGENVFEGFTQVEDSNSFAGREINLVIGNAAGVEIIKGEEVLGPFGETGEVVHKEYIAEEND